MSKYLNSIVDRVNTGGRTGRQPAYVQNWRNFLLDSAYRGEDVFRVQLGNTETCLDFRNGLNLQFGVPTDGICTNNKCFGGPLNGQSCLLNQECANQSRQRVPQNQNTRVNNLDPFSRRARCTMPQGWSSVKYKQDFTGNGGWDALVRLSEPQNNFYGATLMSFGEISAQRALDSAADQNEARRGYTGIRAGGCQSLGSGGICTNNKCVGGPLNGQSCILTQECAVLNAQARCTFLGNVTTPGDVLGESAANYIDKNLGWLVTSDELLEVLFNLATGLIGRLTDFSDSSPDPAPGFTTNESGAEGNQACLNSCQGLGQGAYESCVNSCAGLTGAPVPGDNPGSYDPDQPDWYVPYSDPYSGDGDGNGGEELP